MEEYQDNYVKKFIQLLESKLAGSPSSDIEKCPKPNKFIIFSDYDIPYIIGTLKHLIEFKVFELIPTMYTSQKGSKWCSELTFVVVYQSGGYYQLSIKNSFDLETIETGTPNETHFVINFTKMTKNSYRKTTKKFASPLCFGCDLQLQDKIECLRMINNTYSTKVFSCKYLEELFCQCAEMHMLSQASGHCYIEKSRSNNILLDFNLKNMVLSDLVDALKDEKRITMLKCVAEEDPDGYYDCDEIHIMCIDNTHIIVFEYVGDDFEYEGCTGLDCNGYCDNYYFSEYLTLEDALQKVRFSCYCERLYLEKAVPLTLMNGYEFLLRMYLN